MAQVIWELAQMLVIRTQIRLEIICIYKEILIIYQREFIA